MADTITFPMSIVLIGTMIGGIGGFVLARQAWANKEVPGARSFSSLMLAITGWCLFSLLLVTSSNHSRAISWATLVGLCVTLVPFFWLTFVLEYTGRSNWLTSKTLPLIWAEPVAYILFTLVDLGYGFTNESARVSSIGGLTVVSVSHTPSFYFHLVYLFVVVLTGFAFLLVFLMQVDRLYRKQTTAILFAGLLPLVGTVSFSFAFPDFVLGVTPVFFAGGGVLVGLALFRYDFLDVIPLAAEVVLDEMDDPVIVVDNQRVLDFNEAAATLFESSNVIGCELETVVPGLLEAVSANESFSRSN
ncbi:histidine kinase N-terminal 7TM domain-containing protein [Haladaptatus sp. NG-SE-30]